MMETITIAAKDKMRGLLDKAKESINCRSQQEAAMKLEEMVGKDRTNRKRPLFFF